MFDETESRDYREAIVYEKLRFRDGLVSTRRPSRIIGDSRQPSYVIGDSRPPSCILIESEPARIFLAGHEEFSPVYPHSPRIAKKQLSRNSP